MLYFDLDLNDWVRKPGSAAPPWMEPVLTLGSTYEIQVVFCRGGSIEPIPPAESWIAGIKIRGDYTGDFLASSTTAINRGTPDASFVLDLTEESAAADYFTAHPTESIAACEFQVKFTSNGSTVVTTRLPVFLQNTILE